MATWGEVRAALAAELDVRHDQPGWMGVVVDGALVRVEAATYRDEPWLLLLARVCDEGELPHRNALALGFALPVGALVLNGARYELKHVEPMARANAADVPALVVALAGEATRLARDVGAKRSAATLFSSFEE